MYVSWSSGPFISIIIMLCDEAKQIHLYWNAGLLVIFCGLTANPGGFTRSLASTETKQTHYSLDFTHLSYLITYFIIIKTQLRKEKRPGPTRRSTVITPVSTTHTNLIIFTLIFSTYISIN